jgi:hypothetical protein
LHVQIPLTSPQRPMAPADPADQAGPQEPMAPAGGTRVVPVRNTDIAVVRYLSQAPGLCQELVAYEAKHRSASSRGAEGSEAVGMVAAERWAATGPSTGDPPMALPLPHVANHPECNLAWAEGYVRAPNLVNGGAVDEAANAKHWRDRVRMEKVFQDSAATRAQATGHLGDLLLADQWREQGRVNDLFYSRALRDLDKDRGADARAIGGQAPTPTGTGPIMEPRPYVGYKGQAASASGRVQTGRHKGLQSTGHRGARARPRCGDCGQRNRNWPDRR